MANQLKFLLLLNLFFWGAHLKLSAQDMQALKDYTIEVWTDKDGLPSNNLSKITQDARGYLWISTFDGCTRFDGTTYKLFNTKNVALLKTSAFRSVLALPDSSLYFSTQSSGLLYFKNGVFTTPFENTILPKNIFATFIDSTSNRLWIASEFSGLYYLENEKIHKFNIPAFNNIGISDIEIDSNGAIWVASQGAGVAKITGDSYETFAIDTENASAAFAKTIITLNNRIYVGTLAGLYVFENNKWMHDSRLGQSIFQIEKDKNNNLWFATITGLARLSNINIVEFIGVADGLPVRSINGVFIDKDGSIWLTTYRGGLVRLKPSIFKNYIIGEEFKNKSIINSIYQTEDGRFFIGDYNGGITILNNEKLKTFSKITNTKNISIRDFLLEENGTLWIATFESLIKINESGETVYTTDNGLISNQIRSIKKAKDGSIWVGSRNGGLNIFTQNGEIKTIGRNEGLSSQFVFSIDEAPNGKMVLGTANGGLNVIDSNYNVEIIYPDTSMLNISIFNVYIENNERMWLATNVGLYCYYENKFHLINDSNGLPVETIFDVIEDNNGSLWLTSVQGVIKIDKHEVLQFIKKEVNYYKSILFDDSDGMISKECTAAVKSLLAADGKIWIPTIKGVTVIDPNNLESPEDMKHSSIFIENVIIDDQMLDSFSGGYLKPTITIEPGHRNYQFKFTSLNLTSPQKANFRYMLKGFDENWVYCIDDRVKYTNLPYGKYEFKVMSANNNGTWSTSYASVGIEIKPFFYKTKWFMILLILAFVIGTYLLYKYRTKAVTKRNMELVKLNKELDSFSYSVSHDLKAPLSSIQGLINIARLEQGEGALGYYDKIESSVDKLNSFIKDIMDYSKNARIGLKKEEINIKELILSMVEGVSYDTDVENIEVSIDVLDELKITSDRTRFTFILNNILSNAFRYADLTKENPFVKVLAKVAENRLYLTIEDNGQGIKKEYQNKVFDMFYRANEFKSGSGLGLYIVKESLNKLNGTVRLQSELGVGTKIYIEIPC